MCCVKKLFPCDVKRQELLVLFVSKPKIFGKNKFAWLATLSKMYKTTFFVTSSNKTNIIFEENTIFMGKPKKSIF